ncbi:MAG: efflux RND transporter periplasmic adaptor subunit [Saprospiraceae bacterium]|nr:efflux RND transporter periplasmic adaptor subunit [Saprospiraceae bacterium]
MISSTVDDMVLDLPNEEGSSVVERNTFNEGTTIAVVADMSDLIFEGKVDESDVNKLENGMPLMVTVGAILDNTFKANLEFISPKGIDEEGSIKFEIKAALANIPDNVFLRAGYSANADVILNKINQVVAVQERDVIYEEGDLAFVKIETSSQSYEKKEIELGLSDGIYVEVKTGLDTLTNIKKRTDPQANTAESD